jgi:hypothetical protein
MMLPAVCILRRAEMLGKPMVKACPCIDAKFNKDSTAVVLVGAPDNHVHFFENSQRAGTLTAALAQCQMELAPNWTII